MICASFDGQFNIASTLYGLVSKASVWRGLRTAAHFAIFEAYTELKASAQCSPDPERLKGCLSSWGPFFWSPVEKS
jgi:hypothetical protein